MNTERQVRIIFTSDIHGNYFPFDFRHQRWGKGSLQRVHAFVAQECQRNPGSTLLIDGGDISRNDYAGQRSKTSNSGEMKISWRTLSQNASKHSKQLKKQSRVRCRF